MEPKLKKPPNRWGKIFRKIELFVKKIITPKGKSFFCDSHPRICFNCIMFRFRIRNQRPPDIMFIHTRHHQITRTHLWTSKRGGKIESDDVVSVTNENNQIIKSYILKR